MKILLIEDNCELTTILKLGLEENNFKVEIANDGYTGKKLALKSEYDLIILDVMLPGIDGFEVCKKIRNKVVTPILIITSLNMIEDRVAAFNSGADDYMVKPFTVSELMSRIRSLNIN